MPRVSQLVYNKKYDAYVDKNKPLLVMKCKMCSNLKLVCDYQYEVWCEKTKWAKTNTIPVCITCIDKYNLYEKYGM